MTFLLLINVSTYQLSVCFLNQSELCFVINAGWSSTKKCRKFIFTCVTDTLDFRFIFGSKLNYIVCLFCDDKM